MGKHYFRGRYQAGDGRHIPYRLRVLSTLEGNVSPYYHCELLRTEHETTHQDIVRQAYAAGLPWTREVVYFGELVAGLPNARKVGMTAEEDEWEFRPPCILDWPAPPQDVTIGHVSLEALNTIIDQIQARTL